LDAPVTYTAVIEARTASAAATQFLNMKNDELIVEVGDPHEGTDREVEISQLED
jgi:phosphoribosylcarboxyaminoimidazole (NCAIR) mutase